jgi:hypothetical protein
MTPGPAYTRTRSLSLLSPLSRFERAVFLFAALVRPFPCTYIFDVPAWSFPERKPHRSLPCLSDRYTLLFGT